MTKLTVTGCGECPMVYKTSCGYRCNHPEQKNKKIGTLEGLFATCPLKAGSIEIILQKPEAEQLEEKCMQMFGTHFDDETPFGQSVVRKALTIDTPATP